MARLALPKRGLVRFTFGLVLRVPGFSTGVLGMVSRFGLMALHPFSSLLAPAPVPVARFHVQLVLPPHQGLTVL